MHAGVGGSTSLQSRSQTFAATGAQPTDRPTDRPTVCVNSKKKEEEEEKEEELLPGHPINTRSPVFLLFF